MEEDTAMLTANGASVLVLAPVLATEPVLEPEGYKTAIAVSMLCYLEQYLCFYTPFYTLQ